METDLFAEGKSLLKDGNVDEAITALRAALELDLDNPEIHTYLGAAYSKKGDRLHAVYHFEQSLNLEESARAYFNLGAMYEQSKRFDEAVRQYKMSLEMDKGYTKATAALNRLKEQFAIDHENDSPEREVPQGTNQYSNNE
jgi:Flp pilus assembly protein TadD